jgi:hypothetical protein
MKTCKGKTMKVKLHIPDDDWLEDWKWETLLRLLFSKSPLWKVRKRPGPLRFHVG